MIAVLHRATVRDMHQILKTVYFVRHGQSEGNVTQAFQPTDSPLSSQGEVQAQQLAKRTSSLAFDALIASPFLRARQTAEVIAATTGKEPHYSDLFVERLKPTSIYNKPFTDPQAQEVYQAWSESLYTPGMRAEDGENFDDITKRAEKALDYLAKRAEESLLVVTHGYFMRAILARVLLGDLLTGEAFRRMQTRCYPMENTGISVFRLVEDALGQRAWHLWMYNDQRHLGEG